MKSSLSIVGLLVCLAARGFANPPAPKDGPVRIEGEFTDKDKPVKLQLDAKSTRDMRAKPYEVQLVAGRTYTITLNAAEKMKERWKSLDLFLVVQDPDGKTLAFDDDSGGDLNARLTLSVPTDGTYKVYAAAVRGSGKYVLAVSEANVVRQGFPAAKADPADPTKSDTAWEIEWELTNPDNGAGKNRSTPSSVLAIRSAKFMFKDQAGKPRWLTILKNLEIGEILVPYDHLSPVFLDVTEHAFNIIPAKKEYLGPSCVAPPEILDSTDPRMKDRVHKEVQDDGLRWMNGFEKARRGEKMLLWSLFHGGNYRYIIEYGFNDDGVISCRLGATAHNFFDKQTDGRDVHLHVGCWRWDPELSEEAEKAVGGAQHNRVLLVRRLPRTPAANGLFKVDIAPFNADDKGQAME